MKKCVYWLEGKKYDFFRVLKFAALSSVLNRWEKRAQKNRGLESCCNIFFSLDFKNILKTLLLYFTLILLFCCHLLSSLALEGAFSCGFQVGQKRGFHPTFLIRSIFFFCSLKIFFHLGWIISSSQKIFLFQRSFALEKLIIQPFFLTSQKNWLIEFLFI